MRSYQVQMVCFLLGTQLPQCHFLYASSSGAEIKSTKLWSNKRKLPIRSVQLILDSLLWKDWQEKKPELKTKTDQTLEKCMFVVSKRINTVMPVYGNTFMPVKHTPYCCTVILLLILALTGLETFNPNWVWQYAVVYIFSSKINGEKYEDVTRTITI